MRRVAAIVVVVALFWTIAPAAAQAAAQASKPAHGDTTPCAKRKTARKATKARVRSGRGAAKAKLYAGTLARRSGPRRCMKRSAGSAAQSIARRPPAPGAAAVPATAAAAPAPVAADPPAATASPVIALPLASTLGVEAHDVGGFVLRLTRTTIAAGNLTIYFRNLDVADHNLWLSSPGAEPGAQRISEDVGYLGGATKTVSVTPGAWRLFCSLPGHSSMDRTLTVS
jgi:plastocyanin